MSIADEIDQEYRKKLYYQNCKKCKNKKTDLCELHQTIDGKIKCVEFEEERDESKSDR